MNINLTVYEDGKMEGTVWILFMVRYCIRCMNANTGVKANIGHCKVTVGSSLFQSLYVFLLRLYRTSELRGSTVPDFRIGNSFPSSVLVFPLFRFLIHNYFGYFAESSRIK